MSRLVLIDAYAIIHRAFHAYPTLTTSSGQLVNAVYGFSVMLLKVVEELKPTHLAVCFDLPVPTFRHAAYIGYQASRPYLADDIKSQVELVQEVIKSAGIPIFAAPGYEADDVIGTIATKCTGLSAQDSGVDEVIIVTGDRDMLQLVSDKVKVFMPIKGVAEARLFGTKEVEEYLGLRPDKIVDYKALIGDASDNYPGVPGIGPKTAVGLLKEFGSLDNIYKAIKRRDRKAQSINKFVFRRLKIKESTLQKLVAGYDSALLSQKLARISTDAPIKLDLEKAKLQDPKTNTAFLAKLRELNFRSLVARLGHATPAKKLKKNNNQTSLLD